jgi:plasmid stabilization system protein ParE
MAQLRFTESAERDLVDISNFIARDSPASAARFIARLEEHCQLLAAHPLLGKRKATTLLRGAVRARFSGNGCSPRGSEAVLQWI